MKVVLVTAIGLLWVAPLMGLGDLEIRCLNLTNGPLESSAVSDVCQQLQKTLPSSPVLNYVAGLRLVQRGQVAKAYRLFHGFMPSLKPEEVLLRQLCEKALYECCRHLDFAEEQVRLLESWETKGWLPDNWTPVFLVYRKCQLLVQLGQVKEARGIVEEGLLNFIRPKEQEELFEAMVLVESCEGREPSSLYSQWGQKITNPSLKAVMLQNAGNEAQAAQYWNLAAAIRPIPLDSLQSPECVLGLLAVHQHQYSEARRFMQKSWQREAILKPLVRQEMNKVCRLYSAWVFLAHGDPFSAYRATEGLLEAPLSTGYSSCSSEYWLLGVALTRSQAYRWALALQQPSTILEHGRYYRDQLIFKGEEFATARKIQSWMLSKAKQTKGMEQALFWGPEWLWPEFVRMVGGSVAQETLKWERNRHQIEPNSEKYRQAVIHYLNGQRDKNTQLLSLEAEDIVWRKEQMAVMLGAETEPHPWAQMLLNGVLPISPTSLDTLPELSKVSVFRSSPTGFTLVKTSGDSFQYQWGTKGRPTEIAGLSSFKPAQIFAAMLTGQRPLQEQEQRLISGQDTGVAP